MDIITQSVQVFLGSLKDILVNGDSSSFAQRMEQVVSVSHSMLCEIVPAMLEHMDEAIATQPKRKADWSIIRKDSRELTTTFGSLRFTRRYYQHKQTGQTAYLLDQYLGITPHAKVNGDVRQKAVVQAVQNSYRTSAENASPLSLSKMSVCNYVKDLHAFPGLVTTGSKRVVENLYVEADEDHVALQNGKNVQVKLVYIHEGIQEQGSRRELVNPRYLTWPLAADNDLLWETVSSYIEEQYDSEYLKHVFLSGDCAPWIRKGEEWLYPCVPVLDGYHTMKALRSLCGGRGREIAAFLHHVKEDAYDKAEALCEDILEDSPDELVKRRQEMARYLLGNWPRIRNQYHPDALGCSAEGHVSHILSERLSSRPCGWSVQNMQNMAQLRVMRANGQLIQYEDLAKQRDAHEKQPASQLAKPLLGSMTVKKAIRKSVHSASKQACNTLPILTSGQTTQLYKALHGLSLGSRAC